MSESVNLPALGESVTEGTVTRWLKNVGDRVEVDEPLLEVSTDKVDTEIPSPVAGVIEEILVAEDETVEVGTPLVRIGDGSGGGESAPADAAPADAAPAAEAAPAEQPAPAAEAPVEAAPAEQAPSTEQPEAAAQPPTEAPAPAEAPAASAPAAPVQEAPVQDAPAPAPQTPQPTEAPAAQPVAEAPAAAAPAAPSVVSTPAAEPADASDANGSAGYITPIVRKLAQEKGVDLANVSGTGVGGRIRRQDVLAAAESAAAPANATPTAAPRAAAEVSPLRGTTTQMSRLRKVIAERAVASMQSTAQLTTVVEVDVTKVAALRTAVKDEFQKATGVKLSFLPFFAKAATEALRSFPIINATVDGDSIVYPETENLSIAVDTERGLLTPVVRNAGDKSIADLAKDIADLAARTRDNQLKPDELAGGTFTLTNTGSRGALFDTPVVFLPQVAILGTGVVVKKPAVVTVDGTDAIAIRSTVYLALSYDHRIVDGADAARFLSAVKARLEEADFDGDLGI
ncbi:2-oxoglutarate dehydrogenase, E2 component, dihydrolipoamide succinyltransferase [Yonghaparkia sp. Root332]|uniref:2-oxoglutarate dehydrogenase, E2 component, dihydrolipoamide succinyltransferase n=1 Tax=Yonghaparkia sp. Root332 TaxID=1736516 RepID=UPI0006F63354|nr:2-oxoglutarate dehydrogenase, E2 component, dihydrolipoamide succinyltransferase [Yonghaparkia sp. Root332]KQV24935.1 dihydrolipoamide succinyltransferase [Yonghaparkia sp. Root332]